MGFKGGDHQQTQQSYRQISSNLRKSLTNKRGAKEKLLR